MNSFALTGPRRMQMREIDAPSIQKPTEVLVQIGAVGVCGSDIHYFTTGRIGDQVVEFPFVIGHECAGTVVEVGNGVERLSPGDRVAIEPAMTCGTCDQCLNGRENTCRHNRFLGCPGQASGGLCELLCMPEENLFLLPPDMDLGVATISEPLAIGIYAVQQAGVQAEHRIGILGMGPIGRTVLLPALELGCKAIYCTDRVAERCDAAVNAGALWAGNPAVDDVVGECLKREPAGLDLVFECTGQPEAWEQAIQLLRPGGKLIVIGIPEVDEVRLNPHELRRREVTVVNIRRQRGCVPSALSLIEKRMSQVEDLITHRFTFDATDQAFQLVANYQDGVVKAMIELT